MVGARMRALPIDDALPELIAAFRRTRGVVLRPARRRQDHARPRRAPRRGARRRPRWWCSSAPLAARLAARRVAEGAASLGEGVGYQVRFEEVASARTRIRFVTGGPHPAVLDPTLARVGAVLLDEFHERHLGDDPRWRCCAAQHVAPRPARR